MAVEVHAVQTASDPSKAASDWNERAKPVLEASGALEATGWMALSGSMTGALVVSTRWTSLGDWATAMEGITGRMAPGGDLADLGSRYQTVQRMMTVELAEAGSPTGPFMNASRYSFVGPPIGMDHAAGLTVAAGANGARISTVLSGADMTGHVVGAIYLDSFDGLPELLASITSDEQFIANAQAASARLESRTLFRRL